MEEEIVAVLAFGVPFPKGKRPPWGDREPRLWWLADVCGFRPSVPDEFTPGAQGAVSSGADEKRLQTRKEGETYWRELFAFDKEHPMPAEVMQKGRPFIAALNTSRRIAQGEFFDLTDLKNIDREEVDKESQRKLEEFCLSVGIEVGVEVRPAWHVFLSDESVW